MADFPGFDPFVAVYLSSAPDGPPSSDVNVEFVFTGERDTPDVIDRGVIGGITTTYFLRGYYVAGGTFEFWTSVNSVVLTPPSGHELIEVTVTAKKRR